MKKEQTQKALYDAQVAPLVNQLKRLCRQLGMPMFCTVCYHTGDTPDEVVEPGKIVPINKNPRYQCEYGTDYLSAYHAGVRMQPDYIADCLKVTLGYVPTRESHDEDGDLLEKAEELAKNTLSVEERMQQEMLNTFTENEEEEEEMNSETVELLAAQMTNLTNAIATLTAVVQEMKTEVAEPKKGAATENANMPANASQVSREEKAATTSEDKELKKDGKKDDSAKKKTSATPVLTADAAPDEAAPVAPKTAPNALTAGNTPKASLHLRRYTIDGKFIDEHDSFEELVATLDRELPEVSHKSATIRAMLSGRRYTAYGYRFTSDTIDDARAKEKEDFASTLQPKVNMVEKEEIHLTDENSTSVVKKDTAASNCIETSNLSTKAPGRAVHVPRKNSVDFTANRVAICDRDTKETLRICDSQEEVIAFLQERNTEQREIRWRSVVYVLEGRSNSAYNCVFRLIPRENA